jgi:parallel beta-helix repeat protein
MKHLVARLFSISRSSRPAARKAPTRARLMMERLEDRSLPSATVTPFQVTTTADSGAGSLRAAITAVNADKNDSASAPDTITFAITGQGVEVISLNKALPKIKNAVVIDGTSEQGYTNSPLIALTPGKSFAGDGLHFLNGNATIKGLAVYGFKSFGIEIKGSNDVITADYIGVDANGTDTAKTANGACGLYVHGATNVTINNNTVGNNKHRGIRVDNSSQVTIDSNTISTNGIGDPDYAGIVIKGNSTQVTITNNKISGNGRGIRIAHAGSATKVISGQTYSILIDHNVITGSATQGILIDKHFGGPSTNVELSNNTVTGAAKDGIQLNSVSNISLDKNTVNGNTLNGVEIDNASNVTLTGNTIGAQGAGNGKDGVYVGKKATMVTFTSNDIEFNTGYGVEILSKKVSPPDVSGDTGSNTIQNNGKGQVKHP